jgi:hypothetical protein
MKAKYIVWFPDAPYKAREFKEKEEAIKFMSKQKKEAYLNKTSDYKDDVIYGVNEKGAKVCSK